MFIIVPFAFLRKLQQFQLTLVVILQIHYLVLLIHGLRNNFSRRFLLNGGSIFVLSKILGHSSVSVTEKAYLDLQDEDLRKKYMSYSPLETMR